MAGPNLIPSLRISFSEAKMRKAQAELAGIRGGVPRAISGAINKTVAKGRTLVTDELFALLTLKRKDIRGSITSRNAKPTRLQGHIKIHERPVPLAWFKVKENRKKRGWGTKASGTGVEVQIYKTGTARKFPHAFLIASKLGRGGKRVTERQMSGSYRVPRQPLMFPAGVSLRMEYVKRPDIQAKVKSLLDADLDRQLDSQVNRLLNRKKVDA
jgi:hypothetical protein